MYFIWKYHHEVSGNIHGPFFQFSYFSNVFRWIVSNRIPSFSWRITVNYDWCKLSFSPSRSHHAGIQRGVFFVNDRFCGLTSRRRKKSTGRGQIFGIRSCRSRLWRQHWRSTTGTLYRFQVPSKSKCSGWYQLVHAIRTRTTRAKKVAPKLVNGGGKPWSQLDSSASEVRFQCRWELRWSWTPTPGTANSGGTQLQDWRALLCELHSGRSLTDTEVSVMNRCVCNSRFRVPWVMVMPTLLCCYWKSRIICYCF